MPYKLKWKDWQVPKKKCEKNPTRKTHSEIYTYIIYEKNWMVGLLKSVTAEWKTKIISPSWLQKWNQYFKNDRKRTTI